VTFFDVICEGFDSAISQCGENREIIISIVAKTDRRNQIRLKRDKEKIDEVLGIVIGESFKFYGILFDCGA
jgi:hypothetical protein